jgi:aspartyl aminopeptidase
VSSPRLDNLASSLCSLDALIEYHKNAPKDNAEVSMIMLFDHEEVGSTSAQGANSNMVVEACERILWNVKPNATKEDYFRSIRRSFLISADMAHAIHPNYTGVHQPQHHPRIHEGVVIKINAN